MIKFKTYLEEHEKKNLAILQLIDCKRSKKINTVPEMKLR